MANGLYTNGEMIDSLIVDLNNLPKALIDGQFVAFCRIVYQMGQKLSNLRDTIDNDLKNREATIETLKEQLRRTGCEFKEMTPKEFINEYTKKDGADND